jgi:hypothetical protein
MACLTDCPLAWYKACYQNTSSSEKHDSILMFSLTKQSLPPRCDWGRNEDADRKALPEAVWVVRPTQICQEYPPG